MSLRIQRWVSHLRNAAYDDFIENPVCVEISPTPTFDRAAACPGHNMHPGIFISYRSDGIVGTDFFTHSTANTCIGERILLPDHRNGSMPLGRFRLMPSGNGHGTPFDTGFNGAESTGRHAAAAHRAPFLRIADFPRQVVEGYILRFYCFHRCTSMPGVIITISRSFG